jgi:hypothetical protein
MKRILFTAALALALLVPTTMTGVGARRSHPGANPGVNLDDRHQETR